MQAANVLLTNLIGKLYEIAPVRNELTHDCDGVMLAHEQMASRIWLEIRRRSPISRAASSGNRLPAGGVGATYP